MLNSSICPPSTNEISLARTSKWVTVFNVWYGQAFTSEICWVFQVYLECPAYYSDLAGAAQQMFCISAWACLQPSAWGTLWKGWYKFELSLEKTEISSHALSGSSVKGKQQFLRRRRYCCCLAPDFGCTGSWLAYLGEQRCLRNFLFSTFSINYFPQPTMKNSFKIPELPWCAFGNFGKFSFPFFHFSGRFAPAVLPNCRALNPRAREANRCSPRQGRRGEILLGIQVCMQYTHLILFWRCKSCVSALHQYSETKFVVILIQASIPELARWMLLLWSPVQGCGYRARTHPLWVWGSWGHCFHAGLRASPFLCSYLNTALASGAVPWR